MKKILIGVIFLLKYSLKIFSTKYPLLRKTLTSEASLEIPFCM